MNAEPVIPPRMAGHLSSLAGLTMVLARCASAPSPAELPAPAPLAGALAEPLALVGATVYPAPDDARIARATIVVQGGKIVAVGPAESITLPARRRTLDVSGAFVVAGFQNSHVHFTESKWEDAGRIPATRLSTQFRSMLLQYGFTTVVDTGSALDNTLALRNRVLSGEVIGPRIFTTGTPLYPEHGIPYYLRDSLPAKIVALLPTPRTPAEAAAVAAAQLDQGADALKVFTGSWVRRGQVQPMPTPIAKAASQEAHRRSKLVFSHASNIAGLEVALDAGVDVLAHALDDDRGWNDTHVARMKAGRMAMIPTLKLFGGQPYTKFIQELVGRYAAAGGEILFGTDVGYLPDYDPTEEYVLMEGAGLDWRQILASLTVAPAHRFGEGAQRGSIAPGMNADLVVLQRDPSLDVKAFAQVQYTLRAGRIVYQSQEPPERGNADVAP